MAFKIVSQKDIGAGLSGGKRQKLLLLFFVVLAVAILLVVYFEYLRQPSVEDELIVQPGEETSERMIDKIGFDIGFLKTPLFQNLQFYGDESLRAADKGREHPFLPF